MPNTKKQRTNQWLRKELLDLWKNHFQDVPVANPVEIKFSRISRTRLGSIRLTREGISRILINGIFRDPATPEEVVKSIISHEMIHYAQGFSSKLPKTNRHPHANGAIEKGMIKANLHDIWKFEKQWTKNEWLKLIDAKVPRKKRTLRTRQRRTSKKLTLGSVLGWW
jgi:hypothetical protein